LGPELADKGGLLVAVDEGGDGEPHCCGVHEQDGMAQEQRLPHDDRHDREVHGVPDVPIEPAYNQALGWRYRGRSADSLDHKAYEGSHQHDRARDEEGYANCP
jgi:hypothetical protein